MATIKFFVDRDKIIHQGLTILERFDKYLAAFSIEFLDEIGIGEGPTREFFRLMSGEFCKKKHRLSRRDKESVPYDESQKKFSYNPQGLFHYSTANSQYMHALGLF